MSISSKNLLVTGAFIASTSMFGCSAAPIEEAQTVDTTEALTGPYTIDSSCQSDAVVNIIQKAMKLGRIAASSAAYAQCINDSMAGKAGIAPKYMPTCNASDPHAKESAANQAAAIIKWSRGANPLNMKCSNNPAEDDLASAFVVNESIKSEEFTWSNWIYSVASAASPAPDPNWPLWQIAGTIWHEVMHQYGYQHADTCSVSGYNFQGNTVPYIVDICLGNVISTAGNVCNTKTCPTNQVAMVTKPGATTCACVADPNPNAPVTWYMDRIPVNGDNRGYTADGDWSPGYWKGECAQTENLVGVSRDSSGLIHGMLCQGKSGVKAPINATLDISNSDARRYTAMGDWDYGYVKAECGYQELVSGISQDGSGIIKAARCSSMGAGYVSSCHTVQFGSSDSRGSTAGGDWDYGYVKNQCAAGEVVHGVSKAANGKIKALQCCKVSTTIF